jgi:hypothetical protein
MGKRKTYSGKYKLKRPEKYKGDPTKVQYRSLWERNAFRYLEKHPKVKWWNSEETVVPYICGTDKKPHRYFVDLTIRFMDGATILVEIKPHGQTQPPKRKNLNEALTYIKNTSKWKYAKRYAENRGWRFEIWTEKTLEQLGIRTLSYKNQLSKTKVGKKVYKTAKKIKKKL